MRTKVFGLCRYTSVLLGLLAVSLANAATIEAVAVGNTGNGNAFVGNGGGSLGAVSYEYRMGKYEVTAGQYTEFLNAVGASDVYGLYNASMAIWCGISRSGESGAYSYSVSSAYKERPVSCVSWGDAARFVNWLHNGQPTGSQGNGTTEDGAYYLNGATDASSLMSVSRKEGWKWALPTDSEWFKAGYHKNDGNTANYYAYSTSSDAAPGKAKGLAGFPNAIDDPGNYANYGGVYSGTRYVMVGELEDSSSPYGTFDQGGNVKEWTEGATSTARSALGGHYNSTSSYPLSKVKYAYAPTTEDSMTGFRVVSVPEPATLSLVALGGVRLMLRKRSR